MVQADEVKLQKIQDKIERIESSKHCIFLYETYYEWKLKQLSQQKNELLCKQIIIEDSDSNFDFYQEK